MHRVWGSVGILLGLSAAFTWATWAGTSQAQARPGTAPAAPTGPTPATAPRTGAPATQPAASSQNPAGLPPPALSAPGPAGSQPSNLPGYVPASTAPVPMPTDLVEAQPNGITADQVALRAGQTSYSGKAGEANLRGAAARVDAAWASFLPRLTVLASYTRLSNFTPPSLGTLVATPAAAGLITEVTPAQPLVAVPLQFPLVLDNYLLQATITVPISDYFLKINQNYTSAIQSQDAYRFDMVAAKSRSASDGKVAYYTWLRARGAVIVAVQALNDQRTHLKDAQNQFTVGNASRADVLRAETSVASAELALERARNLVDLSERQVRVAIHAPDDEQLRPGEQLDTPVAPFAGNLKQLVLEAQTGRYEIKSIDANAAAAKEQVKVQTAGQYPNVSAFADGIYANQRRFPATQDWFPSWDVGARLVWSPNDVVLAKGLGGDAEARYNAIEAQRSVTRDGIELEVVQAYQAAKEADFAVDASKRELASATEAYRVARELFNNGRATSSTLTDAETELTRARLDVLNAGADARISRIRLDHALGRDVRQFAATP